jgi:serine/threonine-protein kinase RIO1
MINAGHCATPSGVVGVGKESVVLAVPASGSVIKVFGAGVSNKGASRERLDSDFRFERRARHSRSARKMSVLWAEKEMRNLKRMSRVRGLRSPVAQLLRENVVLMTMVGGEGDAQRPAPRLKNVRFDQEVSLPGDEVDTTVDLELLGREQERARRTRKALARQAREGETRDSGRASDAYIALAEQMRLMFQGARLVHGDLSEYNVLMGPSGSPVIIDVSQAVDTSSPIAERLLRLDCIALAGFFSSWCDRPLSPRALLRFIKDSDGSRPTDLFRASDGPMDPRAWVDVDWDDLETSDPFEEIRYARLKLRQAHGYGDEVDDDVEEEEEEEEEEEGDSAFLSHEEEEVAPLP